jgi:cytochrome P450
MQSDRVVKTISFDNAAWLEEIGKAILAPGGPRAIRVRESGAGGRSVVFVARHADVTSVLMDEATYSLAHYAALFKAIAPPRIQLLMAPQTDDLKRQRDLLKAAVGAVDNTPMADAISRLGSEKTRRAIAKKAVASVLDCFRAREKAEFDIVGEYAYFVPYIVAREAFGLPGPPRGDLLSRFYATLRWFGGATHRFTPETIPFLTAVYWAQLAFAQVFRNFENREWHYRWLGTSASARLVSHIRGRVDLELQGYHPYPESLLNRLCKAIERALPEERDRDRDYAASLLIEMFGTTLLIPPLAFTGTVDWMVKQKGGIPACLKELNDTNARAYVDELLRLAPPSKFLLRTATKGVMFDDVHVDQDGYVCALVAQACRDPEVFKDPNTFSSAREQRILHFGPVGGPHQCLGRELARDMFTEMLLGLRELEGLWPVGGAEMKDILGISQLMVSWNREARMVRAYGPHRSTGDDDG